MLQSQKQALRFRRALLSNIGLLLNIFLSQMAAYLGYFVIDAGSVLLLSMAIWLGHGVFVCLIAWQWNLKFSDASLTLGQMLWVTIGLSTTMVFLDDIRHILLMGQLLVLSFGAFRLSRRGFYGFSLFTLSCYLTSLLAIYWWRPTSLLVAHEFFVILGFVMVLLGFAIMGSEFSHLRGSLVERHRQLKSAVARIEELAITDELTALYNRRHLIEILQQQRALANRSHYGFVVCYLDLDHFKKVNDQYGHQFGDKVLRRFADLIRGCLREVDVGARLGGEEFVLILADTQVEAAKEVCQRLAHKWLAQSFSEAPQLKLTLSAGISEYKSPETIEQVLERADGLLYEAKNSGRNCIMVEDPDLQVPLDLEGLA